MASKLGGFLTVRYRLAKLSDAAEEFMSAVFQADKFQQRTGGLRWPLRQAGSEPNSTAQQRDGDRSGGGLAGAVQAAYRRAQEVYDSPLTEHMYLTGPAMAPTLNRRGAKDSAARERLVVRVLRRPGPGNVMVGDVVAFHSPLAQPDDPTHVMVRRVAAVEGQEMVSSSEAEPPFLIPPGHCWVLADNAVLRPEDGEVIDSRSYGHIPFSAVIGRVVYAAASRADHGPVRNNPAHSEDGGEDAAVVAAEVDVEGLLREEEGEEGEEEEEEEEEEDGKEEGKGKEGEGKSGGKGDGGSEKEGEGKRRGKKPEEEGSGGKKK